MEETEVKTDGRVKRFAKGLAHGAKQMLPLVILVGAYAVFDRGAQAGIRKLSTGEWVETNAGDVIEIVEIQDTTE